MSVTDRQTDTQTDRQIDGIASRNSHHAMSRMSGGRSIIMNKLQHIEWPRIGKSQVCVGVSTRASVTSDSVRSL